MAKIDGIELGIDVHECKDCEYKNGPRKIAINPETETLLVLPKMCCKPEYLRKLRDNILSPVASGVVTIPFGFDVMAVPKEAEFWKG